MFWWSLATALCTKGLMLSWVFFVCVKSPNFHIPLILFPGAASSPRRWRSGRPSWSSRRRLTISTNAALYWRWWQARPWWRVTGTASRRPLSTHSMWSLMLSYSGILWWLRCWRTRKILRFGLFLYLYFVMQVHRHSFNPLLILSEARVP